MLSMRLITLWACLAGPATAWAQLPPDSASAPRGPLPRPLRHVFLGSQLSQGPQAPTGRVVDASFDNLIIRPGDQVRVACAGPCTSQVGDNLFTFATSAAIKHPVGHTLIGHLTDATGLLTVTRIDAGGATLWAQVEASVMEIERGQRVLPLVAPLYQDVVPKWPRRTEPLVGRVVAIGNNLLMGREERAIFVDVGRAQGLEQGDVLAIRGRRDTAHPPLPRTISTEAVAQVVLVNVGETVSTAMVADGLWEVTLGDTVTLPL